MAIAFEGREGLYGQCDEVKCLWVLKETIMKHERGCPVSCMASRNAAEALVGGITLVESNAYMGVLVPLVVAMPRIAHGIRIVFAGE